MKRGVTLIEMLVALAITLIMMAAVVTLFSRITSAVSDSRAAIEMSDRLRAASNTLRADLEGITADINPPLAPEMAQGYFEILEGPMTDYTGASNDAVHWSLFGDMDDALMFTTRSRRGPFLGQAGTQTIESTDAEVVYFVIHNGPIVDATTNPVTRLGTLYRRVFLVKPALGATTNPPANLYNAYDVSARYSEPGGTPTMTANSLSDLTKRENRFAHYGDFPFAVDARALPAFPIPASITLPSANLPGWWNASQPSTHAFLEPMENAREGNDVLLTNVLAFDVQVYDPEAEIRIESGIALEPSDPGWAAATIVGATGTYVDLGYGGTSTLGGSPDAKSQLASRPYVYDTWSLHYENNGINEDSSLVGDLGTDTGFDGLDNDTNPAFAGTVDDKRERDTLPPYEIGLRGIRVTVRVYEPSSKQVREATIVRDL